MSHKIHWIDVDSIHSLSLLRLCTIECNCLATHTHAHAHTISFMEMSIGLITCWHKNIDAISLFVCLFIYQKWCFIMLHFTDICAMNQWRLILGTVIKYVQFAHTTQPLTKRTKCKRNENLIQDSMCTRRITNSYLIIKRRYNHA